MSTRLSIAAASFTLATIIVPFSSHPRFGMVLLVLLVLLLAVSLPPVAAAAVSAAYRRSHVASIEQFWARTLGDLAGSPLPSRSEARLDSLRVLAARRPGETPLAGGRGRIQDANRAMGEDLKRASGGLPLTALTLDADWVATPAALSVVSAPLGLVLSWPWSEIEELSLGDASRSWEVYVRVHLCGGRAVHLMADRGPALHLAPVARQLIGRRR